MACSDLTAGIGLQCKDSIGGLQKLYFFNNLEDAFTITGSEATGINILLTQAFEFDIQGDNHILEQNVVSSQENFTTVNTQTLTFRLAQMDAVKHATLSLLLKGRPMAVVRDRNDQYHACGLLKGFDFTDTATSGQAMGDFNGYQLVGTSMTGDYAPILNAATVTAFLALVV